jgi:DNA polymerase elongation subunit (family B)
MEDISKKIKKLDLKQNAIKVLINSYYGANGNKYFYFYDPDIAQSITIQGQDLIKFSIKAVNHYFLEKWHLDKELHEYLGIEKYKIIKINDEAAIYTDTDSIYVQFDSVINSIVGANFSNDEALNICVKIDNFRLSKYFDQCFQKYGQVFNTVNRLKFKLENLSQYGIWLKKKNYAIKVAYEPNSNFELIPQKKRYLIIKGLEPIKSSYPDWARKNLITLTEFVLEIGKTLDLENQLIPKLVELQKEFLTLSIHEVAFNFNIRVYNKYIDNIETLSLKKGISIYPRAAAYYNNLLLKTGLNKKYPSIREKDKIKFYYCAHNEHGFDVFAYSPEVFPTELAPPCDLELQFFALIVEPINRLLEAMNIPKLDSKLKRTVEVIKIKSKKEISDSKMYPLYTLDRSTLEYEEVPEKFWKIIGNPEVDVSEEEFPEYISVISKYGLNTSIVPKCELEKYILKLKTKKEKEEDADLESDVD